MIKRHFINTKSHNIHSVFNLIVVPSWRPLATQLPVSMHLPGHRRITKNSHQLSTALTNSHQLPSPPSPHLHHLTSITAKPTQPLQYNYIIEQTHTIPSTTYTIITNPSRQSRIAARHRSDASRKLLVLFNFPGLAIPTATCRTIRTISGPSRTTRLLAPKLICMSRQNDVTGCLAVCHPSMRASNSRTEFLVASPSQRASKSMLRLPTRHHGPVSMPRLLHGLGRCAVRFPITTFHQPYSRGSWLETTIVR
jgi:hypothetical protein